MSAPADVAAASAAGEDQVAPLAKASPAAAGASSSVSIQPFSGGRVVHGHKPSTAGMGSMDLSEESRDTVEVKDSDTWYPQFSPSATLGPAKPLGDEKKSGLNALLSNRMDRARFQERFLRPGSEEEAAANAALSLTSARAKAAADASAREASAESLFNRSAKLGALLANRPDKARLESLNVLKAPQGAGRAATSNAFAGMQAQLDTQKRKDKLNALLAARPSAGELSKRRVLREAGEANGAASSSHASSPAAAAAASSPSAAGGEPRASERLAAAKSTLGDFIRARPTAEQLVKQKIITDVGDLPGGLERKQDNVLEPTLLERGSLAGGKKVVQVSLGFSHSLVLTDDGVVHVFGSGANGRLGLGEGVFGESAEPRALDAASCFGGEAVASVDAGENHSLALTRSGKLYAFGTGTWGRLGLGSQDDAGLPRRVSFASASAPAAAGADAAAAAVEDEVRIVRASAGAYHTLALSDTGDLYAFGWNKNGRCGVGRQHPSLLLLRPEKVRFFVDVSPSSRIRHFEAGQNASYACMEDGRLFVWGQGAFGLTAQGDEQDHWLPRLVDMAGTHVHRAAVGATHMLAVDVKGQLYAWGANDKGQTGVDVSSLSPEAAPGSGAAASATPAAVISPRGGSVLTPVAVTLPAGGAEVSVSVLAAGKAHSLVVDGASGSLWGWGSGARGVLGTGGESDQSAGPVRVEAAQLKGERIVHLDTAWTHSAAVTESGKLFLWGAKNNGRTGL